MSTEICPVCGIKRIDGVFYYSHTDRRTGKPTAATPNQVTSRICAIAILKRDDKAAGCINNTGVFDKSQAMLELSPEIVEKLT